jgi:hypothetical protein
MVERSHYDVREALFKATDGEQKNWSKVTWSVFWADRVTVRKRLGCSPYTAATGTQPLLPLDIVEATYLIPPPTSPLSTEDLIVRRAITLQKRDEDLAKLHSRVFDARNRAARRFEKDHSRTMRDYNFATGALVLMRNTKIEKSLNRKMRARYLGPLVVISRNRGGAYIVSELNGAVFDRPIGAFRLIPYFPRSALSLPPRSRFIDITSTRLAEMEQSVEAEQNIEEFPDEDIDYDSS